MKSSQQDRIDLPLRLAHRATRNDVARRLLFGEAEERGRARAAPPMSRVGARRARFALETIIAFTPECPPGARLAAYPLSFFRSQDADARFATAAVAAGPKTWYRRDPRNPRPTGESCLRVSTRIVTAALPGRCERPRSAIRVPATVEEEQCRACCSGRSRLAQVAVCDTLAMEAVRGA